MSVNCNGAQAPFELIINCVILGVVIIVLESDYLLFWQSSIHGMVAQCLSHIVRPALLDRCKVHTKWEFAKHAGKALLLAVLVVFANPFQVILQYLMGFVTLGRFVGKRGEHDYSPICAAAEGYPGFERNLALCSTILAFVLVQPAFYILSCILVPHVPTKEWLIQHQEAADGATLQPPQLVHRSWFNTIKLCAPDLIIVFFARLIVSFMSTQLRIPEQERTAFSNLLTKPAVGEQQMWTDYNQDRLPHYYMLCRIVCHKLCEHTALPYELLLPLSLLAPVHLLTSEGRLCWYVVVWNYATFLLACCGVWLGADAATAIGLEGITDPLTLQLTKYIQEEGEEEALPPQEQLREKCVQHHSSSREYVLQKSEQSADAEAGGNTQQGMYLYPNFCLSRQVTLYFGKMVSVR